MKPTILSSLAATALFVAAATQWSGPAAAAKNTKPQEIVVVPYPGKGTTSSGRKNSINLEPSFQGGVRVGPSRPAGRRRLRTR